jgi:hypothetical protein
MCDQQMIFSGLFMKRVVRTELDTNFFLLQRKCGNHLSRSQCLGTDIVY